MAEFFGIIFDILQLIMGSVNQVVGWLIDIKIFEIPLLVFLATLDIIAEIYQYLFNNIDDSDDEIEYDDNKNYDMINEFDDDLGYEVEMQVLTWKEAQRYNDLREKGYLRDQREYEKGDDLDV
jgi:hypothetical protein